MSIDTTVQRTPGTWCLCRNAGCLAWMTYLAQHRAAFGSEPTEDDLKRDAVLRAEAKGAVR